MTSSHQRGGAFSGKDPSRVDRSAAYTARFLARQTVARDWASRIVVQLSYATGVAEPASFAMETFGSEGNPDRHFAAVLSQEFDLRPQATIERLTLKLPINYSAAAYGHFGRTGIGLPCEATS